MNDMTRTHSAARLSEDIGDVLSAIRRLIAEDEAMDYNRGNVKNPSLHSQNNAAQGGEQSNSSLSGHAAMARRMVAESAAVLAARAAEPVAAAVGESYASPTSFQAPLVADPSVPAKGPIFSELTARRDMPARPSSSRLRRAWVDDDNAAQPLRLKDSDRVISEAVDDSASWLPDAAAIERRISASNAIAIDEDDDDFAEAFDAKARMRPGITVMESTEQAADHTDGASLEDVPPFMDADRNIAAEVSPDDSRVFLDYTAVPESMQAGGMMAGQEMMQALSIPGYCEEDLLLHSAGTPVATAMAEEPQDEKADDSLEAALQPDMDFDAHIKIDDAQPRLSEPADEEEASIRELLREMVQEELHGELGQRFSRNLRAVIRREVAAAIDEHLERL